MASSERNTSQVTLLGKANRLAWSLASQVKHRLFPEKEYVVYQGSRLPLPGARLNGPDQADNEYFLNSALREAERVITRLGCTPQSLLVDIGCGQGRLPIGLARIFPNFRYIGLDVSEESIHWCQQHIERRHPTYRFQHINLVNARYNPAGHALAGNFRLPVADGTADIVYLWGVVTNMEPEHLAPYAAEISRMLRAGGRAFLTANVEDNVPQVSINPEHYMPWEYHGPLNIVRYEKQYFLDVFRQAGLTLTDFAYHAAGNCQSDLYFGK